MRLRYFQAVVFLHPQYRNVTICDPLSENPALFANNEFELEAILSIQVVFLAKLRLLNQGVTGGLHCIILNYEARLCYYKLELTGRSVKYGNVLLWTAKTHICKEGNFTSFQFVLIWFLLCL